jgi:hypothetical protein
MNKPEEPERPRKRLPPKVAAAWALCFMRLLEEKAEKRKASRTDEADTAA